MYVSPEFVVGMAGLNIADAGLKGRSTAELARKLACLALPSSTHCEQGRQRCSPPQRRTWRRKPPTQSML